MLTSPRAFVACCVIAVGSTAVPSVAGVRRCRALRRSRFRPRFFLPLNHQRSLRPRRQTAQPFSRFRIGARRLGVEQLLRRELQRLSPVSVAANGHALVGRRCGSWFEHDDRSLGDEQLFRRLARMDRHESGAILGGKEFQFSAAFATSRSAMFRAGSRRRCRLQAASRTTLAQVVSGAIKVSANRTRPDGTNLSFRQDTRQ
jgi:hypothetical protein